MIWSFRWKFVIRPITKQKFSERSYEMKACAMNWMIFRSDVSFFRQRSPMHFIDIYTIFFSRFIRFPKSINNNTNLLWNKSFGILIGNRNVNKWIAATPIINNKIRNWNIQTIRSTLTVSDKQLSWLFVVNWMVFRCGLSILLIRWLRKLLMTTEITK